MDIGQAALDTIVIKGQAPVIQAKQVQNGGVEIINGCDVLGSGITEFVRRAV